jgi:type II secretory ATPase GspE/PulE/Tfp pilus assembly ATPase PilB-like protein
VEYRLPEVNQVQVDPHIGMSFAASLKTILRQDPDIVLVGEIRDGETAALAVHAALTGHLVLSSLHTNDAAGAVARLVEMGVEPFLLASCLLGAVAQRLIRTVCGDCKTPFTPEPAELRPFAAEIHEGVTFYHGTGCRFCYQTGYRGRVGVFEILRVTERVRGLIVDGMAAGAIREAAVQEGMTTLVQAGLKRVLAGVTTLAEVRRVLGGEAG